MGKHKADRFSQTLANKHGRTGMAPQAPLMKARQGNQSKRGK